MATFLCVSVQFLDPEPAFHGRGDGGAPEWPPSPLRVFQAMLAAAAARWTGLHLADYAGPALMWLEAQDPPVIVAPAAHTGRPIRSAVPNNDLDVVARDWARGRPPRRQPAELKTLKTIQPNWLGEAGAVHFLWQLDDPIADETHGHLEVLKAIARSLVSLGWGLDLVAGHAVVMRSDEVAHLAGEQWSPTTDPSAVGLRVPALGTYEALVSRHQAFLDRVSDRGLVPVPALSAFATVGYNRPSDRAPRPFAAFQILDPDGEKVQSFDTPRRCRDVAAWVRHAAAQVCEGWPFGDTAGFVLGHDPDGRPLRGDRADERFMYLPLPTINHALKRVEAVRRVLVAAPPGFRDRVEWVRRRLPGQELVWDGKAVGLLNLLPTSDWVLQQYTGGRDGARAWSTVTPVVWPGHDDHDPRKAEAILRKAFVQAGLAPELVAGVTDLEWRPVGFRPGTARAEQYAMPASLTGHRYHVRVRFPHPVRGPLAVGAGRYRGVGLFATDSE